MELKTGIKNSKEMIVTKELCADAWGSGGLTVYATPAMIALMENTAWASVEPFMEEGRSTVGTKLDVSHLSASPVGSHITCETELVEIDGHFGEFVALSGDGVEHKALVAQRFDALPDRLTRYAETRRERLSGDMVLRACEYFE